jgi:hypothetical protein
MRALMTIGLAVVVRRDGHHGQNASDRRSWPPMMLPALSPFFYGECHSRLEEQSHDLLGTAATTRWYFSS